jgi:hypothetical protein
LAKNYELNGKRRKILRNEGDVRRNDKKAGDFFN